MSSNYRKLLIFNNDEYTIYVCIALFSNINVSVQMQFITKIDWKWQEKMTQNTNEVIYNLKNNINSDVINSNFLSSKALYIKSWEKNPTKLKYFLNLEKKRQNKENQFSLNLSKSISFKWYSTIPNIRSLIVFTLLSFIQQTKVSNLSQITMLKKTILNSE